MQFCNNCEFFNQIGPEKFRLRNDLYCVEWGIKLYLLIHSRKSRPLPVVNKSYYMVVSKTHYNIFWVCIKYFMYDLVCEIA